MSTRAGSLSIVLLVTVSSVLATGLGARALRAGPGDTRSNTRAGAASEAGPRSAPASDDDVLFLPIAFHGHTLEGYDRGSRPRPVGHIGGPCTTIATDGRHAFIAVGPKLVALDISDPSQPAEIGRTAPYTGTMLDSVLADGYVYGVARNDNTIDEDLNEVELGGLRVFDVRDPRHPRLVGKMDGRMPMALAPTESGFGMVTVDYWGRLEVIDVSRPAHPRRIGALTRRGSAWDVAVGSGHAFVAMADKPAVDEPPSRYGVWIVDITDPAAPRHSAFLDLGATHTALSVAVSDGVAFVGVADDGLRVVDVSIPSQPEPIAKIQTSAVNVLRVADGFLYALAVGERGVANPRLRLETFDTSDPEDPHPLGAVEVPGKYGTLAVSGRTALVTMARGVALIDLSPDRKSPRQVSGATLSPFVSVDAVVAVDNLAYVASGTQLNIVDAADPSHPRSLGEVDLQSEDLSPGPDVAVGDGYAYVSLREGLRVVDIRDSEQPDLVASVPARGLMRGVAYSGTHVFVAEPGYAPAGQEEDLLRTFDVSDPAQPREVSRLDGYYLDTFIAGHWAYLAGHHAVHIADVADPGNPQLVSTFEMFQWRPTDDLVASGGYVFAVAGGSLYSIDVSDVRNPHLGAYYRLPGSLFGMPRLALDGSVLYVTDAFGLRAIDVSAPTQPRQFTAFPMPPANLSSVSVDGDHVFTGGDGLWVFETVPLPARSRPDTQ